jgi:hypothetical protein
MGDEDRGSDVMCCLCGRYLPFAMAATLVLYSHHGEGTQELYTHRDCLRRVVVSDIALLSEDEE